jgi:hypothetical protein
MKKRGQIGDIWRKLGEILLWLSPDPMTTMTTTTRIKALQPETF